jgi:hypothetical protein
MVIHHLLFDLVEFLGAPEWLFSNFVFNILHYFRGPFHFPFRPVLTVFQEQRQTRPEGFRHRNRVHDRDEPAVYQYAHPLRRPAPSRVLHGLLRLDPKGLGRDTESRRACYIHRAAGRQRAGGPPYFHRRAVSVYVRLAAPAFQRDYFPIFPWLFVFLLGTWAGFYVRSIGCRMVLRKTRALFPRRGKKALLIYILHRPFYTASSRGYII